MRKTVAGLSVAVLLSMTLHAQEKPVFTPIQPPVLPHALGGSDAVPVPMEDNTPPNYTSFPQKPKPDLQAWKKYNPKNEYDHPEFGTLPDDAPCANCVELLDKRKATQRYYEDLADPTKIYIQKSLDNINMQEQGRWISTSPKLHAEAPGTYASGHGLEPVSIDLNRKEVILHTVYGEVTFNNWSLWAKRNGQLVQLGTADWSHYTIGEDGMVVTNIFKGIDAELRVLRGAVKTSFTIKSNAYGAFSELIFRDDFNEGNGTSIRFSGDPTSKKGTGSLLVSLDGKDAIKVGEAVARLKDVARDGLFVLPYELDGKGMNIVVPGAWINANIKNHQLIIDPLVTGTNSLAASAITGSAQSTAASCGFDNYCSYSLTVTQPAATTITDVNIAGGIFATAPCFVSDGGFAFLMGSCVSPAPGEVWWCGSNTSGGCAFGGNSMFSSFSSCLPAPSCATQDLTFKMILCRTCKGVAGCDGSCIGTAGPFTVTLICHTVEFAIPAGGSAITITGDTCQGQGPLNAKVTAYGGVPPYSITWSTNASGTPVYATGATTTFNYPTAGSYPVYAFITDACNNSFQTTKTITIDPPKFATANITICANQLPYSWNGQSLTAGGMAVATYITPSLVTGCDSTTTLNLTVNTLPAITTQPTNATILINSNATFSTAATGTGPLTYQWQVNTGGGYTTIADGGVYSNSATPNLTITNAPLGMNGYTYRCIVSGVCTPAATSNDAVLTVNKDPQTISSPSVASGSTVVHTYGDPAYSAAATASSGLTVAYSSSDTSVAAIDATGEIAIIGAGSTQITVSQPGNGTYLAAPPITYTVQVDKKDLLITADNQTRPYGMPNPTLTMQYSGFVYGQNQSAITEPVIGTSVITTTLPGTYPITLTGGSAANYNLILTNGTFAVTGAVVTIDQQPKDISACAGENVSFKTLAVAASPVVNVGYQWQQSTNGSNWQNINGATADTCSVNNENSQYVRCLITAPGTNMTTQTVYFTVNPLPDVRAAKSNDIDCNNGSATLNATGGTNYNWTPVTGLSDPKIANPVATPTTDITYTVTGTSDNGCSNSDTVQVKVTTEREGENVMANAFTPNGDGNNDCFGVRYWGEIRSIEFDIYNRFGALVFHSTTPGECWDGRMRGQDQPIGTYVYFIHAVTQCGVINKKGTVILIR